MYLSITGNLNAQDRNNFLLGVQMDVIKTDIDGFAEKSQVAVTGNYFFAPKFSGTVGLEFWSARQTFLVLGARFYPVDPIFIKFRGLIADHGDVTLGMGYRRGLGGNFQFEGGMDYFFNSNHLGIRCGLAYLF